MESVLSQGKAVCPFLQRASVSSLKRMTNHPHGRNLNTMSALQVAALECPVMGKHMAKAQQILGVQNHRAPVRPNAPRVRRMHKSSGINAEQTSIHNSNFKGEPAGK